MPRQGTKQAAREKHVQKSMVKTLEARSFAQVLGLGMFKKLWPPRRASASRLATPSWKAAWHQRALVYCGFGMLGCATHCNMTDFLRLSMASTPQLLGVLLRLTNMSPSPDAQIMKVPPLRTANTMDY